MKNLREPPSTTRSFLSNAVVQNKRNAHHHHHNCSISKRFFRAGFPSPDKTTTTTKTAAIVMTPLDADEFQSQLLSHVPSMAASLLENGYYTTIDNLLPMSTIQTLREQSISLRFDHNRFEASYSETIDETTGRVTERFDKEGVYACEPDGRDYYEATDIITYMSLLLQTLPVSLNAEWEKSTEAATGATTTARTIQSLSSDSFNAKLAVTEHGGAKYPLHVDNPQGLAAGDTRKLTCILYLNPHHEEDTDGGEIRLFLPSPETSVAEAKTSSSSSSPPWRTLDLSPIGGRLLVFWSDEIPHEVLPTTSSSPNNDKDRYALTIWIPTSDAASLHNASSKFHGLKDLVFAADTDNNNPGDSDSDIDNQR
jgi:Rps23 Pro-64 3,4-dihydroxylase Tpa1-like proline 4-hydroxylase